MARSVLHATAQVRLQLLRNPLCPRTRAGTQLRRRGELIARRFLSPDKIKNLSLLFMDPQPELPTESLGTILLVEDETTDAILIQRAFEKVGVRNPIAHLAHGDVALAYLEGINEYSDRLKFPLPILIILDLKLPGMGGLQLLKWIRTKRELRMIPVVVLTGSADTTQVQAAYEAGANSYLLKPADRNEIVRVIEAVELYWMKQNVPPPLVRRAQENL